MTDDPTSDEYLLTKDGVQYWPCVPGVNPETGEWACGICGAPGESDCIEEKHVYVEVERKPYPEDTWFDRWLDAPGHEKIKLFYLTRWLTWETRTRRFFSFRARYRDWKFERQFKVGGFFLDHGSEPAVITNVTDAVRGVSLVNAKGVVSDFYNCGPIPCTEKAAWRAAERIKQEQKEKEELNEDPRL